MSSSTSPFTTTWPMPAFTSPSTTPSTLMSPTGVDTSDSVSPCSTTTSPHAFFSKAWAGSGKRATSPRIATESVSRGLMMVWGQSAGAERLMPRGRAASWSRGAPPPGRGRSAHPRPGQRGGPGRPRPAWCGPRPRNPTRRPRRRQARSRRRPPGWSRRGSERATQPVAGPGRVPPRGGEPSGLESATPSRHQGRRNAAPRTPGSGAKRSVPVLSRRARGSQGRPPDDPEPRVPALDRARRRRARRSPPGRRGAARSSALTYLFEPPGQHVPGAEEPALYRRYGDAENLGYLRVAHPLRVAEDDRYAVGLWEGRDGFLYAARAICIQGLGFGSSSSPRVRLRVELDHLPAASQGVHAQVVGDGEQPGLETVVRVEGLQAVVGTQEGLLYQILDGDL